MLVHKVVFVLSTWAITPVLFFAIHSNVNQVIYSSSLPAYVSSKLNKLQQTTVSAVFVAGRECLTLCMLGNFSCFVVVCRLFFKINFFKKFFQEHYQIVNGFGSRSGSTFCRSWSGYIMFAKVFIRRQKLLSVECLR